MCMAMCKVGCECAPGYVRNEEDNTCCLESECPGNFEEEEVCPLNEEYDECGSACPLTCNNYKSPPDMCTDNCIKGCRCQDGYVRNEADNTCCLESECPATETEHVCPLNEVYNECGSSCPATCNNYKNPPTMCNMMCNVGCECAPGYVRNEADNTCCLESECPAPEPVCALNQVYTTCGTACPLTCENYNNPPQFCTMQCVVGCECNKGYVKKSDGSCCLPSECTGKRTWRSLLPVFNWRY
ncbi:von Willebrand factor-like isoform X6 [Bradysia coprophila]|uniref:von Willebrand factor-like isoform X6 n=1 Tax=Bradysia coprophila TaxID=38358 RepID=UPI00187DBB0A|nr:von Willebrand factor-like isoform X6 [Bradysia coprophila]